MIASVSIPHMLTEIEQRQRKTADIPLAVAEPPSEGGVIRAVSALAYQQGVRTGMKRHQATALCPNLAFIPPSPHRYQSAVDSLENTLTQFSSHVEPAAYEYGFPNQWYIDLRSVKSEEVLNTALTLSETLTHAANLPFSIGVANGKFSSEVAAIAAKGSRIFYICEGHEADFIGFFPIRLLPLNTDMARRLPLFGIRTVGQYAALPKNEVQRQFGKHGAWVHQLANGQDPRPVKPYSKPPVIRMSHPLEEPIANRLMLDKILNKLCQQLTAQLKDAVQTGNRLALILLFENGSTAERAITLRRRSADPAYLLQNLNYLLSEIPIKNPIAEVAVWLTGIGKPTTQQASLFDEYRPSPADLNRILKQLQERYGAECFVQATIANANARIPERRFRFTGSGDS